MSADNYHLVDKRSDGTFVVLTNLSASDEYGPREWNRMKPAWTGHSLGDALNAAHKIERSQWTEYGITVSARASGDL